MTIRLTLILASIGLSSGWLMSGRKVQDGTPPSDIKSSDCKKSCFYYEKNATFSCSNRTCDAFPNEMPETTKVAILEVNNIKEIRSLSCGYLKVLDLSTNKIELIEPGVFRRCSNLTHIDLSLNSINKTLTGTTFEILTPPDISLQHLDLSFNKIEQLPGEIFQHLTRSLEFLDLSNNCIKVFDIQSFKDLYRLKRLILSSNDIRKIEAKQFIGLYALIELVMNDNHIATVFDNTFTDLDHLEVLDLEFNEITAVETDAFVGLENLEKLVLSHNQITTLDPKLFDPLVSLTDLHLDFNPIMTIHPRTFPLGLVYLTMVNLEILEEIPSKAFANLLDLDIVHLSFNTRLHTIAADAFGGRTSPVRELSIKNNSLTKISHDLLNWERVTNVDMGGNNWACDCDMKWIKEQPIPNRNLREMRCASPQWLVNKRIDNIPEHLFTCEEGKISNKIAFRTGMVAVTTFAFFFALFAFLYKCRTKVMPCWFAKPGKYFALYNAKDMDDASVTTNGFAGQGVVKHRNGAPAPVHV